MRSSHALKTTLLMTLLSFVISSPLLAATDGEASSLLEALGNNSMEVSPDSNCFLTGHGPGCDDAVCEATVCAVDSFCCDTEWDSICVGEAIDMCDLDGAGDVARFSVKKDFDDDNPQDVEVTLTCQTGLPLVQTFMISEERSVVFVVKSYEDGALNCTLSETVPDGYTATYSLSETNTPEGCSWESLPLGAQRACLITNSVASVPVTVNSEWLFEGNEADIDDHATGYLTCTNAPDDTVQWSWDINGNGSHTEDVIPNFNGTTVCTVSSNASSSEVETSGCEASIIVNVGDTGDSCTLTFTVFFEGIPTINSYGLAILALLMLSVGFVAFRRIA